MEKASYAGKIKNSGSQVVEALNKQPAPKVSATVKTGTDLRTGKAK